MPEWLWWFFEPFTKPMLEMTTIDEFKIFLTIIIGIIIVFIIALLIIIIFNEISYFKHKRKYIKNRKDKNT